MHELTKVEAEKLLAGIVIPPRPTVVTAVMEERTNPEPNARRIVQLISTDVGLSAAVLKTVNSPLYGLKRQVGSIEQAVMLLGMKNIGALVMGLALRKVAPTLGLDRFWDSAARTALLASHLAQSLGSVGREEAHLFGLFHDCGIPLMMQRFPDYKETLRLANFDASRSLTDLEDERYRTNHAVVGSLLAKNWNLPEHMREAILHYQSPAVLQSQLKTDVLNLIALVHLAAYIENRHSRLSYDAEWDRMGATVLAHLMLDESALEELMEDARDMLDSSEA